MSDDSGDGGWAANGGTTLPEGSHAIYNIMLSPLFVPRSGRASSIDSASNAILNSGNWGRLWSSTVSNKTDTYDLAFAHGIWPSANDARAHGFSLRCLVSTNNR